MTGSRYRENWQRLLYPRAVALVGASDTGLSSKYVYENMKRAGFAGDIYLVNPRHPRVFGVEAFRSIAELPSLDVAVILLARERVEEAVQQAIANDVGGIIIVTGGFRETGDPEWVATEGRLVAAANAAEVPLIGPNCLGVMALPTGAMMTLANYPWPLRTGSIALLMQSGGQLLAACRYVNFLGGGVRWGFSVGNGTTVSFAEILMTLANDPEVQEIVLLIEEIGDWDRFKEAAKRARQAEKWITALVIGKTAQGQRAAATHTGAVAVNHEIVSAGLAQLGIQVGETLSATLAAAVIHSRFGDPERGGIGIAGVSGGGSGLSADLAFARGIQLSTLGTETVDAIQTINPEVHADNPIDIIGGPLDTERFRAVFEVFLRDPDVGAAVYLPSQGVAEDTLPGHVQALENVADAAETIGVPVIISPIVYASIPEIPHQRLLMRKNVCVLPTIEEAFAALTIWRLEPLDLIDFNRKRFQAFQNAAINGSGDAASGQLFDEVGLKAILNDKGCLTPESLTLSVAEALRLASGDASVASGTFCYPVVVKGTGRAIFHKANLGLVQLGVGDRSELEKAIRTMLTAEAADRIETVLVERQLEIGIDVMVSVISDRIGTVVLIGEGGAGAGGAGKVTWLAIAPDDEDLLAGARHILAKFGAEAHAASLVVFVRKLVSIHAQCQFALLEINPARILPSSDIYALDAVATAAN